jgi:hypothetical protein
MPSVGGIVNEPAHDERKNKHETDDARRDLRRWSAVQHWLQELWLVRFMLQTCRSHLHG